MLRSGFSVDQVVHGYGEVCQTVTAVAVEQNLSISTDEFRTLKRRRDSAIADAVASFNLARQTSRERDSESWQRNLDAYATKHGRLIDIVIQAFGANKTGNVRNGGATGTLFDHAFQELQSLAARTLPEIFRGPQSSWRTFLTHGFFGFIAKWSRTLHIDPAASSASRRTISPRS